tara:strand:- start:206 stop:649 length:444 start_codon:yes stop_codon:yes gene_type:complete
MNDFLLKLFIQFRKILRKIPLIRRIDFIDEYLVERSWELEPEDGHELYNLVHEVHFWAENGSWWTSREFHLSRGGDESKFEKWEEEHAEYLQKFEQFEEKQNLDGIYFWHDDGKWYTSRDFHVSRGGDENDFFKWAENKEDHFIRHQ